MLTIVQRGGATREKPPEIVRGQSSRLPWVWDGLCCAIPFNDATRDSSRDIVANVAPSEWNGTPTWGKDNRGNVAAFVDDPAYIGYPETPAHNKPTTALTVYARIRRTGTPFTSAGVFCKVHTPGVDPYMSWAIQVSDLDATALAACIAVNGVNIYWVNDGYTTGTTLWMNVFMRWSSGSAPRQDILGERGETLAGMAYGSTVSGTVSYNTSVARPIRINAGDLPTSGVGRFAYSQCMLWSRRLTDAELQALVADPYGWYSPRRETIGVSSPYPLIAGAGEMKFGTGSGGLR